VLHHWSTTLQILRTFRSFNQLTWLLQALSILGIGFISLVLMAASAQAQDATPTPDLVATVNDEGITRADYQSALMRRLQGMNTNQRDLIERQVLDALIEQVIIRQTAAEIGLTVSEDEIDAQMAQLRGMMADDAEWQAFLQTNGFTEAEMRAAQRDAVLTQRVRDIVVSGLNGDVLQARARHILVRTEAAARTVIQRLQAGEGFAAVAQDVSIDQLTRDTGGDLGWFIQEELVAPNLAQVIFSLQPGQVAGPVASQLGFHVVQTQAIAERPIDPERLPVLMETVFISWLDERIAAATIERFIEVG
jgi:peptidyl-prolyl cis-trans isomerase C